jgi:hypothetical protein
MKNPLKFLALLLAVSIALMATVFSAFASAPALHRTGLASAVSEALPSAQACARMQASDVAWVTLDDEGDIDEQVEAYPSGSTGITPIFEYNCVPKKTTIVTVFSFEGETVYTDKEQLKASNSDGVYGYPLATTDDSPMDEGEWGVEFYNNKTLLTSSTVIVGAEEGGDTVTVIGTIKDAKTKKGIKGAVFLVLVPDVTVEDFIDGGQQDEDVYTAGKTDGKGYFELENPLEREVPYSVIVVAKGYKPIAQDGLSVAADDPDPLELDIKLTK